MKKIIYFLLFFSLGMLHAQQIEKFSIDSGGTSTLNEGIAMLYTIGEINVKEYNNSIIVSEGFINPDNSGTLTTNESFLDSDVVVYPNPASESISIKSEISIETVEIYNVFGSQILSSKKLKIDIGQLQSGFFIMRIKTQNGQIIKNILIE